MFYLLFLGFGRGKLHVVSLGARAVSGGESALAELASVDVLAGRFRGKNCLRAVGTLDECYGRSKCHCTKDCMVGSW